jgi:hypothetical protein
MKFKSPSSEAVTVVLITGHSISVPAGGRDLPVQFRREALARGCVPVGVELDDEPESDPNESTRMNLIVEGIEKMLDSDTPGAFKADGKPDGRRLSQIVGFTVTREQRDLAWKQVQISQSKTGNDE